MNNRLKIGYFADGPWSHQALDLLIKEDCFEIKFICGRYKNTDKILQERSKLLNIDFLINRNVNDKIFIQSLQKYSCDLFVSMSFDQIMRKELFSLPREGTINCHAGKLPMYRGRNVLNWVLINDENEFGITVHYIDEGIDTGDIIMQKTFPITDIDTYKTLLIKSYKECAYLLIDSIKQISKGNAKRLEQMNISRNGMYCSKRIKGDEIIIWNNTSRKIFNFIRALTYPGPGAKTKINGVELTILKSEFVKDAPSYIGIAGSILLKENNFFLVKTQDSYIKILEWESNVKLKVGDRFEP